MGRYSDIADDIIDFFANEDVKDKQTLSLALLEPLKIDKHDFDEDLCGDEAFVRDHNLLPKLIVHPNMTLAKILKIYPNIPWPKYFNKNAKVNKLLDEWLPFVAEYSREYLVKEKEEEAKNNEIYSSSDFLAICHFVNDDDDQK